MPDISYSSSSAPSTRGGFRCGFFRSGSFSVWSRGLGIRNLPKHVASYVDRIWFPVEYFKQPKIYILLFTLILR